LKLEYHVRDFEREGGERWGMVCLMAKGAHGYSGTGLSEREVRGLYCMVSLHFYPFPQRQKLPGKDGEDGR
jgi:hypothetical protein